MLKLQKLEKEKLHQQINKKWVRMLTVVIYIISVSLVAVILGLYYRFWWQADYSSTDPNNDLTTTNFESIKIATFKLPRKYSNKPVNITEMLNEFFIKMKIKSYSVETAKLDEIVNDEDTYEIVMSVMVNYLFFFNLKLKLYSF
jgi:hypothetical protein